ncbi:hypothetical protein N5912_00745 [Arcobacter lacus]|uniref:hypothetical protein n=1 Tax=Arcobacter lacus TaxID=1912876 RepID=UPI0021BB46EE|nr:hypothetical protein [Arcobacter lacus]MCT7910346.1 hypothetical protein [Arcobacter lacus]
MFFEGLIPTMYETTKNKHLIEKDRLIIEKKLTKISENTIDISKPIVIKNKTKNVKEKKQFLQQFKIKYSNPFFVNLNDKQKEQLKAIINSKGLKHLVLHTYTNDNEVAIKRLENIYNILPPLLRINTIYKQDLCYEGNICDTTNIKLIY